MDHTQEDREDREQQEKRGKVSDRPRGPDNLITNPLDKVGKDGKRDKLITNPLDKPGAGDNLAPNPLDGDRKD